MTIFFDKKILKNTVYMIILALTLSQQTILFNIISVLVYQVENKVWEKLEMKWEKWQNINLKCISVKVFRICIFNIEC